MLEEVPLFFKNEFLGRAKYEKDISSLRYVRYDVNFYLWLVLSLTYGWCYHQPLLIEQAFL